MLYVKEVLMHS